MGHPDALTALLNPSHEVTSHFASSPFQEIALKQPGIHVVLESRDALGGDGHVSLAYGTTKFYQENPKTVRAFLAAYEEAVGMIKSNPKAAAETYLSLVKERATVEEVVAAPDAAGRHLPGRAGAHHGLRRVHGQGRLHQADAEELEGLLLPPPARPQRQLRFERLH